MTGRPNVEETVSEAVIAAGWEQAALKGIALGEREVHLWAWQLEASGTDREFLKRLLAEDELARMANFRFEGDRLAYLVARGTLRRILGLHLSMPPEAVRFAYSEYGRPGIAPGHGGLEFNLSHTGKLAIVAVARSLRVGVDLEDKRSIESGVAQHLFSQEEQETLQSLDPGQRLDGFYRCWTRKEAISKAEGLGLNLAMSAFSVSLRPEDPPCVRSMGGVLSRRWILRDIPAGPEVAGALAVSETPDRIRLLRIASALP